MDQDSDDEDIQSEVGGWDSDVDFVLMHITFLVRCTVLFVRRDLACFLLHVDFKRCWNGLGVRGLVETTLGENGRRYW